MRKAQRPLEDAVAKLMVDKSGRIFINWLLSECHIYHQCNTPEQEGERRIGLKIIAELNKHPELNIMMLQQNFNDSRADETIENNRKQKDNDND